MVDNEMKDKSFWQVAITLPKENSLVIEEFMVKSGALGFHELLYEEGITENLNNDETIHYYYFASNFPVEAFIPMVLGLFECSECPYEIQEVRYEEFLKSMEETFTPFSISRNFSIVPPWKLEEPITGTKLIINPAFAFGTGRHATSQLMIEIMEDVNFKDKNVLDMGCGSGILTIASLLLGASHAIGVDVESLSVESSTENYKINKDYHKISTEAEFFEGDFSWIHQNPDYKFDIFLSNILPDIFYKNEKDFLKYLESSETWILSGIVREKENEFFNWLSNLTKAPIINRREKDEWLVFYNF